MVFGGRLHKLEKLVSDPYLLYLANKNMFKLKLKKTHIILILSQPVFALSPQCCVLSGEATHANCIILVWPDRGTNRRSTAREASTLTITPPMRFPFSMTRPNIQWWGRKTAVCHLFNLPTVYNVMNLFTIFEPMC